MSAVGTLDTPRPAPNARIAWGVIWIAFSIFCLLCGATGVGTYYFLFNSSVPMQTLLRVSRGTAGVTGPDLLELVVRSPRFLLSGEGVTIPSDAQGLLLIEDTRLEAPMVAAITLENDARLTFEDASRPRFDWGTESYRVQLDDIEGEFDILVPEGLNREVWLEFSTAEGDTVFITQPGRYLVSARGDSLQLTNLEGSALLVADDRTSTRAIGEGQRGLLHRESNVIDSQAGYINLLGANSFRESNIVAVSDGNPIDSLGTNANWVCTNPPHDPPRGIYDFEVIDGRPTVHMLRGENATTHGETRCTLRFGPGALGVDISGYNYLAVRATFQITGQSLNVCGVAGSECPLMLNFQYVPDQADAAAVIQREPAEFGPLIARDSVSPARNWYKGFYIQPSGSFGAPLRCDSCTQEHSFVRSGEWYTYDSGNLLALIPEAQRPRYMLNVSFYASGHQYEVFVSELMLLVGNIETPAG